MDPWIWAALLLLIGMALIFLEVFLPSGGALSLMAVLAVIGAIVVGFTDGLKTGTLVLAAATILTPICIGALLRYWPRSPLGKLMLITPPTPEEAALEESDDERRLRDLVGRRGRTRSKMLPSGAVEIDGRTYDAVTDGLPLEAGQPVRVAAVRLHRLVVRPAGAEEPAESRDDDPLAQPIDELGLDPFEDPLA